ncbi:MAG: hypothetical protein U0838_08500 [Chloroflexota bacterium]
MGTSGLSGGCVALGGAALGADAGERDERRARPGLCGALEQAVEPRILDREGEVRRPERPARSTATTTGTSSSRFVRASTARVEPSSGQVPMARATRAMSSLASGAEDQAPGVPRPRHDALREPLAVVLHEAHRPGHDRRRTAVVGLEVQAPQPGQRGRQVEHAPHVGKPPAIHGLIVVADEECIAPLACQQHREVQLRAVQVLRLVHQQRRAPGAPPHQRRLVALEQPKRAQHEVVEVQRAVVAQRPLVGHPRPRHGPRGLVRGHVVRRHPQVQLEAAEREVEPPSVRGRHVRPQRPQHLVPIRERRHVHARLGEDLPAQRVEGPHPDATVTGRGRPQRLERGIEALHQLLGGALVERNHGDGPRRGAPVDQPRHPGHQRRGLARACRRHDQHRPRRRRGGRPLVRGEPGQPLGDGGVHRGECGPSPLSRA